MIRKNIGILIITFLLIASFTCKSHAHPDEDIRIDMSFKNADIIDVFGSIARAGDMNIVTDHTVSGTITIDLEDVSLMTALDIVARTSGYDYIIIEDVVVVASRDLVKQEFEKIEYKVYKPQHIDIVYVEQIASMILSSENVNMVGDRIVMSGTDRSLSIAQDLLNIIDIAPEISVSFKDASIREVLTAIADKNDLILLMDPGVSGEVTVNIEGLEYTEVLDKLAGWYGFTYEIQDKVLSVRSLDPLDEEDYDLPFIPFISTVTLDYISGSESKSMILSMYRDRVVVEVMRDSILVIKGREKDVSDIVKLLKDIDNPEPQVLVEVRVQEVSLGALEELGFSWSLPSVIGYQSDGQAQSFGIDYSELNAALNALIRTQKSRLLAHPSVAAVHGGEARVFIGDRIPIILETMEDDVVMERIDYFESGVLLEMTPEIGTDGLITLNVKSEVSNIVGYTPQNHPEIRTREVETRVRVADGEPVVIGGLIKQDDVLQWEGVPFLSGLPLIGNLFRSREQKGDAVETLIFITPRLVTSPGDYEPISAGKMKEVEEFFAQRLLEMETHTYPTQISLDLTGSFSDIFSIEIELSQNDTRSMLGRASFPYALSNEQGLTGWAAAFGLRWYASPGSESLWADIAAEYMNLRALDDGKSSQYYYLTPRTGYMITGGRMTFSVYTGYNILLNRMGDLDLNNVPGRDRSIYGGLQIGFKF